MLLGNLKVFGARDVALIMIECLPSMQGVLGSTLSNSDDRLPISLSLMEATVDLSLLASLFQLQPPEC